MDELLRAIFDQLRTSRELLVVSLMLGRTMPMIFLTPFLGGKLVPPEIKIGTGVVLCIIIWPGARGAMTAGIPVNAFVFLLAMLKEVFIGLAIGFVNAHLFYAMDMAGRLIDTSRGTSMAEVQDPHSQQRASPVGNFYNQLFIVVFVVAGGHHIFIQAYAQSFISLPIDKPFVVEDPGLFALVEATMRMTANILVIAVILAAPIIAATLISDVVFGILNRVAPQLNAYFMSMPVKAIGGVIMIFIAFDAIFTRFNDYVVIALEMMEKTIQLLSA